MQYIYIIVHPTLRQCVEEKNTGGEGGVVRGVEGVGSRQETWAIALS